MALTYGKLMCSSHGYSHIKRAQAHDTQHTINILVMSGDGRWIYSLALDRGDFRSFMLLLCLDNQHFQLGVLDRESGDEPLSVLAVTELPDGMVAHYNVCNAYLP